MDTLRTPTALATLVATNIAPLVGIVAFGWSPSTILLLYLADTLLTLGAVVLLVMAHVTGNDGGRKLAGWKDWTKALLGMGLIGAIFSLPIALPIIIVVADDPDVAGLAGDSGFLAALFVQGAMSALAVARQHRELQRRDDDDRLLARRLFFLVARWVVLFMAVVTGLASLLGPRPGGLLLVAVYAGATIYFELFPDRAERLVRGREAKPIVWQGDLDAVERQRDAERMKGGPATGAGR